MLEYHGLNVKSPYVNIKAWLFRETTFIWVLPLSFWHLPLPKRHTWNELYTFFNCSLSSFWGKESRASNFSREHSTSLLMIMWFWCYTNKSFNHDICEICVNNIMRCFELGNMARNWGLFYRKYVKSPWNRNSILCKLYSEVFSISISI